MGYYLTENQIYYPIYSTKPARIARIQAAYFRYTPSDEVEEIGSADVLENGEYRIEHDAATNITATIDYLGATVSITSYTHITIATVSGLPDTLSEDMNVRVILNGNPIKATERLAERRLQRNWRYAGIEESFIHRKCRRTNFGLGRIMRLSICPTGN